MSEQETKWVDQAQNLGRVVMKHMDEEGVKIEEVLSILALTSVYVAKTVAGAVGRSSMGAVAYLSDTIIQLQHSVKQK